MEIAIDMRKWKSYVVVEYNGKTVKEGHAETRKDGFYTFFDNVNYPKSIVEASSTVNRIANIFLGNAKCDRRDLNPGFCLGGAKSYH